MKLIINTDRSVIPVGTWGTVNENDYEILDFEFPAELEHFNKRIVYYLGDEKVWDTIVNNKAYITNAITTKGDVKAYVWCTKENTEREADTDFRTMLFDMHFYENENADGIVPTEEQVDGFNTMLTAMNDAIDEMENLEETVEQAISNINQAIQETENLDIDVSDKVDGDVTVTLTKKDASTKTVVLSDGTSLMFNWNGTSLGIKTEDDAEYTYVDLQGVQGPVGPQGEAFQIKKTYSSVAEMNADFNNMELGDYVMIASTVEVEDNAKLYTRGQTQWIFISDFSGAQGIKGETGATPNIQIGTVTSGAEPNVTRSGTNENPILNFTLVKGDKGDTGNTGATGPTGNGIASITKTGTSGLVDTYTITYTDGTTTTFTVTNGQDGEVTQEQLDELQEEVTELSQNMPWNTTEQATEIQVTDAAKYSKNKLELFGNTYQLSLPSGYTHLEYIESTGTQYINLDYVIKSNTKLEIEYQTEKVAGNTLFGASNNNMNYYASGLGANTAHTGQDNPTNIKVSTDLSTEKTSLLWERAQVTYNGNIVTGNFGLDDSSLVLFKNRRWPNDLGKVKLYKFIAYDGNIIAANYIPCKNSNNEIGLYDVVSNTFYGNSGTGDLVAGTDLGTIPSPDFPQPIHVVTGENTIKVQGKNLISGEVFEFCTITNTGEKTQNSTRICTDFIELDPAKQYFLSASINYNFSGIAFYDNTYTYISRLYWNNSKRHTIATTDIPSNTKYAKVFGQKENNVIASTSEFEKNEWYLEEGNSNNTKYVPYYHADYPINLGSIELCKIGDYQDYLYKENGNWYINKLIDKNILTDTDNWEINTSSANYIVYKRTKATLLSNLTNGYCNYFIVTTQPSGIVNLGNVIRCGPGDNPGDNNVYYVVIQLADYPNLNTLENWLSWLENHNIVFYGVLRTSTSTQITNETLISQLDAIYEHLQLVKGTNNISITASDLAPYMELTYMQDLKSKLDNLDSRLALLE